MKLLSFNTCYKKWFIEVIRNDNLRYKIDFSTQKRYKTHQSFLYLMKSLTDLYTNVILHFGIGLTEIQA